MIIWRNAWEGRVCAGDFLSSEKKNSELNNPNREYLIVKGMFIYYIINIIWGCVGLVAFSVICLALSLKY